VQLKDDIWLQLEALGLSPNGVVSEWSKCNKAEGFAKFNVACKWKRKYWESAPDEGGLF